MVAYSFNRRFVPAIESGMKSQTIRAHRRRHARPGEQLQLYTGMRTKSCRLIRSDVVCSRIDEISIDLMSLAGISEPKTRLALAGILARWGDRLVVSINGRPLDPVERETLATQDGFAGWQLDGATLPPFAAMVLFWMGTHGPGLFEGVMISWERA
jgi:hypothetical protein